jgi:integrase
MRAKTPTSNAAVTDETSAVKQRHRTLPTEVAYIKGYPTKLFIYKSEASPFWWVRYYVAGKTIRKSTKTESKQQATAVAKEFYSDLILEYKDASSAKSKSNFELLARELLDLERSKCERGELTKITYDNTKYRFDKHILPYFRKKDIKAVDYYEIEKFLASISDKELTPSTISAYLRLTRKVFAYAARKKIINQIPEFPTVKVKDVPRGWFTYEEFRKLKSAAVRLVGVKMEVRKWIDAKGDKQTQYIAADEPNSKKKGDLMRRVDMTADMNKLIMFMSHSYIRPTDIKFLQHAHVDVVIGEYKYLRLRLPPTKNHSDPITTMPSAITAYLKLKEHHAKHKMGSGDKGKVVAEDYVFLPQYKNRDYALKQLQRQWEILMWRTGLGKGPAGEERTLYSLRHTAIMFRLLYGVGINTLALARNARTSVEMIDRFYAKPLSGEMNIEMLQSSRRDRKIKDGDDE